MGAFPASRARILSTEPTSAAVPNPRHLASPVPSPCVSLCKMDMERRYCLGCLRTIAEIVAWCTADDDYKRARLGRAAPSRAAGRSTSTDADDGLPDSIQVFERGWLSSNNVLADGRRRHRADRQRLRRPTRRRRWRWCEHALGEPAAGPPAEHPSALRPLRRQRHAAGALRLPHGHPGGRGGQGARLGRRRAQLQGHRPAVRALRLRRHHRARRHAGAWPAWNGRRWARPATIRTR